MPDERNTGNMIRINEYRIREILTYDHPPKNCYRVDLSVGNKNYITLPTLYGSIESAKEFILKEKEYFNGKKGIDKSTAEYLIKAGYNIAIKEKDNGDVQIVL